MPTPAETIYADFAKSHKGPKPWPDAKSKFGVWMIEILNDHCERLAGQNKSSVTPRKRNEQLDDFARVFGLDPMIQTKPRWSSLAKALSDIKEASPNVTIQEIQDRAKRHRRDYQWALTEASLAKYWGSLVPAVVVPKQIQEEPESWRIYFSDFLHVDTPWAQLDDTSRNFIISDLPNRRRRQA